MSIKCFIADTCVYAIQVTNNNVNNNIVNNNNNTTVNNSVVNNNNTQINNNGGSASALPLTMTLINLAVCSFAAIPPDTSLR